MACHGGTGLSEPPTSAVVQGHCSLLIMAQGCPLLVQGLYGLPNVVFTLIVGPRMLYRLFNVWGSDADSVENPTGPIAVISSFDSELLDALGTGARDVRTRPSAAWRDRLRWVDPVSSVSSPRQRCAFVSRSTRESLVHKWCVQ